MKKVTPTWYAIIADEATDVANREQFNLSLRWMNDEYEISEDPVGLFCLPSTTADTITMVLKDFLIRCDLPVSLCRGQSYDGVSKTARTSAIEAVLKAILMETMADTTHNSYGLTAGGILSALEKFSTISGLKLGYTIFGTAEEVSKGLQAKDLTIQEAI